MRTIENTENVILHLDKVIQQKLIPALSNDFRISEELRNLIVLPCKLGGMGNISSTRMAGKENVNSRKNLIIRKKLVEGSLQDLAVRPFACYENDVLLTSICKKLLHTIRKNQEKKY